MTSKIKTSVGILFALAALAPRAEAQSLDINRDGLPDYELIHYFDCVCPDPDPTGGLLEVDLVAYGSNEILVGREGFPQPGVVALLPPGEPVSIVTPANAIWEHPTHGPWVGLPEHGPSVSLIFEILPVPSCCGDIVDAFNPPDPNVPWIRLHKPLGYVGLRFAAVDGNHYGYLGLTVERSWVGTPTGWQPWITGYDSNPVPGEGILAPIPEPATFALLAVGACTLATRIYVRRGRRDARPTQ